MMCVLTVFCRSKLVMFVTESVTIVQLIAFNWSTQGETNASWWKIFQPFAMYAVLICRITRRFWIWSLRKRKSMWVSHHHAGPLIVVISFACARRRSSVHDPQRVQSRTRPSEDGKRRRTGEAEPWVDNFVTRPEHCEETSFFGRNWDGGKIRSDFP